MFFYFPLFCPLPIKIKRPLVFSHFYLRSIYRWILSFCIHTHLSGGLGCAFWDDCTSLYLWYCTLTRLSVFDMLFQAISWKKYLIDLIQKVLRCSRCFVAMCWGYCTLVYFQYFSLTQFCVLPGHILESNSCIVTKFGFSVTVLWSSVLGVLFLNWKNLSDIKLVLV